MNQAIAFLDAPLTDRDGETPWLWDRLARELSDEWRGVDPDEAERPELAMHSSPSWSACPSDRA